MNAEPTHNQAIAFVESFRDYLVQELSSQCGTAWLAAATPAQEERAETEQEANAQPEAVSQPTGFHAIFTFEGSLNGDLHLELTAGDAVALASALLGAPSTTVDDAERDAMLEFLDAALPGFCESADAAQGTFSGSLTVTVSPSPAGLEVYTFSVVDGQGAEFRLRLLVDADLDTSLAEWALAQQKKDTPSAPELPAYAPAETDESQEDSMDAADAPLPYQAEPTEPVNLELVLDVELNVTLRFGQRQLTLREVLELTSGSVIELDRQVEEPVELLLDGKVIARGEAVVIDGNYGLRVTEVPQQFNHSTLRAA
jgi:flagellar motor switch protein FliN